MINARLGGDVRQISLPHLFGPYGRPSGFALPTPPAPSRPYLAHDYLMASSLVCGSWGSPFRFVKILAHRKQTQNFGTSETTPFYIGNKRKNFWHIGNKRKISAHRKQRRSTSETNVKKKAHFGTSETNAKISAHRKQARLTSETNVKFRHIGNNPLLHRKETHSLPGLPS